MQNQALNARVFLRLLANFMKIENWALLSSNFFHRQKVENLP